MESPPMTPLFFSQVDQAIDGAVKIAENRSEPFVAVMIVLGFAAFMVWKDSRDRKESAERHAAREASHAKRLDTMNDFNRQQTVRNTDQLDKIADALQRMSHAGEIMAESSERTEAALGRLANQQIADRRAIASAIDGIEQHQRGDVDRAAESIRNARTHLMSD